MSFEATKRERWRLALKSCAWICLVLFNFEQLLRSVIVCSSSRRWETHRGGDPMMPTVLITIHNSKFKSTRGEKIKSFRGVNKAGWLGPGLRYNNILFL